MPLIVALAFVGSSGAPSSTLAEDSVFSPTVVDNADAEVFTRGTWLASAASVPYGEDAIYAQGRARAVFAPKVSPGYYNVFVRWTSRDDLSARVPIIVKAVDGRYRTFVNQRENGDQWNPLGAFDLDGRPKVVVKAKSTTSLVCADAVMFELVESHGDPASEVDTSPQPTADPEPTVDPEPGAEPPAETAAATLIWEGPAMNEDGTQLEDLAGFNVYQKSEDGEFVWVASALEPQVTFEDMPPGVHTYAVSAYDTSGNESYLSDEVVTLIP